MERLDNADVGTWAPQASTSPVHPPPVTVHDVEPGTPSAAPIFLIREVASEVGLRRHHVGGISQSQDLDIISRGLVTAQDGVSLIELSVSQFLFNPFSY